MHILLRAYVLYAHTFFDTCIRILSRFCRILKVRAYICLRSSKISRFFFLLLCFVESTSVF